MFHLGHVLCNMFIDEGQTEFTVMYRHNRVWVRMHIMLEDVLPVHWRLLVNKIKLKWSILLQMRASGVKIDAKKDAAGYTSDLFGDRGFLEGD